MSNSMPASVQKLPNIFSVNTNPFKPIQPKQWGQLKLIGEIKLSDKQLTQLLPRLKSCYFSYAFSNMRQSTTVDITTKASIELDCNRCNQPFTHVISSHSNLALSTYSNPQIEDWVENIGLELFVYYDTTRLVDLILEEIHLNLPHIPRCQNNCELDYKATTMTHSSQRPFADLKQQMQQAKSQSS